MTKRSQFFAIHSSILAVALLASACAAPAFAKVLIFDSFEGSDFSIGDSSSINGGFSGFASNQFPNFSSGIEANGAVTLTGDSFTRDSGYGLISNTGFDINQQITIDWNISSAFLENQADADHKDLDKITLGVANAQGFAGLFTGLEISLENGGQELRVRLHDSFVGFIPDDYVSGLATGWNGQDSVSVTAVIDPLGYSIAVSTMQGIVSGLWSDQTRNVSYVAQLTNPSTNLSYVFMNHFGSDTVQGPPHHFTSIDSVTVSDSLTVVAEPGTLKLLGSFLVLGSIAYRRKRVGRHPAN